MKKKPRPPKNGLLSGRYNREFIEVVCPTCKTSKIICIPEESIPQCDYCRQPMVLKEILTEGKY